MSLSEKIDRELKEAMMAKDEAKTSTLRFLKSALKYGAIEKKAGALSDAEVFQVINKQIKQHRESVDQFVKAGRVELASKETREIEILQTYLPQQLSDNEIEEAVRAEVRSCGAETKKDFGRVMKALTEKLAGRADSKKISGILGGLLK